MPRVTMPKDHPYTGGVTLPDGQEVTPGKSVDVDEALAASLEDQGWTVAEAKTTKTTPVKGTKTAPAADTKEP